MDWILDNIDWLFPIVIVLLFWFQNTFMKNQEGERKPPSGQSEADAEAERIREEIRRKIVARQQGHPVQGAEPTEEVLLPRSPRPIQEWPFAPQPTPVPVEGPVEPVEALQPQEDLLKSLKKEQERLRRAQREREKALRRRQEQDRKKPEVMKPRELAGKSVRDQILVDLSSAQNLKRAFILKEIVDRPVGIRQASGSFPDWS